MPQKEGNLQVSINPTKITVIGRWQTNADFSRKLEIDSVGARVKICSATELKEQISHKCSRVHGPSQLRLNLKFGSAVQ
jgi:hypothetical protein